MENKKYVSLRIPHTEEEIEELKKSATEVRIPGGMTLDEVVEALEVFKKFNQNIYMTFGDGNAPTFYSCNNPTLDEAYMQVYGDTRSEYWKKVNEIKRNWQETATTSKEKAKSLIPERFEEGKKYMYPERFEQWKERLEFIAKSSYNQRDVKYPGRVIECLKRLEDGEDFQSLLNFIKECDDGEVGLAADALRFSKIGPEFFEYVHKQEGTDVLESDYWKKLIADTKSENSRLAELHRKSPLQQKDEELSSLEAEAIRDTAELKDFESKDGQNIGEE